MIGNDLALRDDILNWLHASVEGGHSGVNVTIKRVKVVVYLKGLINDIKKFIQQCSICQECKYDTATSPDFLQPLPFLNKFGSMSLSIHRGCT